jgi:hypothetical protein
VPAALIVPGSYFSSPYAFTLYAFPDETGLNYRTRSFLGKKTRRKTWKKQSPVVAGLSAVFVLI